MDADTTIGDATRRNAPPAVASSTHPFTMQFGPGLISGSFHIRFVDDADQMIEMINVMKGSLKKKEAAN